MDEINLLWHQLTDSETIIRSGLMVITLIVFAENGLFFAFFFTRRLFIVFDRSFWGHRRSERALKLAFNEYFSGGGHRFFGGLFKRSFFRKIPHEQARWMVL